MQDHHYRVTCGGGWRCWYYGASGRKCSTVATVLSVRPKTCDHVALQSTLSVAVRAQAEKGFMTKQDGERARNRVRRSLPSGRSYRIPLGFPWILFHARATLALRYIIATIGKAEDPEDGVRTIEYKWLLCYPSQAGDCQQGATRRLQCERAAGGARHLSRSIEDPQLL